MQDLRNRGNLEQVEAFAAVADLGSFAAAAARIGRDASLISRRVSMLEARLGTRLLSRTTRRVALTEAGTVYLKRVQAILDELASADAEAADFAEIVRGSLRIAVPNTFGRRWIAPLLPGFIEKYPELRLDVSFSDRFVDIVAEGFDVAVRVGVLRSSTLISRHIAGKRSLLCASPKYLSGHGTPRTPGELSEHSCIGFSRHSFWPDWPLRKGGHRVTVRPKGPLVTDNAEAGLYAAISGTGILLSSDWLVSDALRSGDLVEVLPGWTIKEDGGIYAVMPPGRLIPAKTRVFVDHIAFGLAETANWCTGKPARGRVAARKR